MAKKKILIVGAGISGLSTAYYLNNHKLKHNFSIDIIEKSNRVGGSIETFKDNGYTFEFGPRGFLCNSNPTIELIDSLSLWDKFIVSKDISEIRYLYKHSSNSLIALNLRNLLLGKIFGFKDTLYIFKEFFSFNKSLLKFDETIASFINRRFPKSLLEDIIEPVLTGIYAGDCNRMSVKYILKYIKDLEQSHGSVLRGMLIDYLKGLFQDNKYLINKKFSNIRHTKLASFNGGLGVLVDSLYQDIKKYTTLNTYIKKVDYINNKCNVLLSNDKYITYDHIIYSTPSYVTADYIKDLNNELYYELKSIDYSPIISICIGFDKAIYDIKGYGFLTNYKKSNLSILGAIFNENVFDGVAPKGANNLNLYMGGINNKDILDYSDDNILKIIENDLKYILGKFTTPNRFYICRYKNAIPHPTINYIDKIDKINKLFSLDNRVFAIGNYLSRVAVNNCISNSLNFTNKFVKCLL